LTLSAGSAISDGVVGAIAVLFSLMNLISNDPVVVTRPSSNVDLHGHALVIHGLNMKPEKMDSLSSALNELGIETYRLGLKGHTDGTVSDIKKDWKNVVREDWLQEVYRAHNRILEIAEKTQKPIFLLGYSLGALVALDATRFFPSIRFEKMILIAPALTPKISTGIIHFFRGVLGGSWMIPSQSSKEYRVHDGTSMAAYDALAKSADSVCREFSEAWAVPTLTFIDPKDELVNARSLQKWIDKKNLRDKWNIQTLPSKRDSKLKTWHHLVTDEDVLGSEVWTSMKEQIREFLS